MNVTAPGQPDDHSLADPVSLVGRHICLVYGVVNFSVNIATISQSLTEQVCCHKPFDYIQDRIGSRHFRW